MMTESLHSHNSNPRDRVKSLRLTRSHRFIVMVCFNSPCWTRARVLRPAQTAECRQAGTRAPRRSHGASKSGSRAPSANTRASRNVRRTAEPAVERKAGIEMERMRRSRNDLSDRTDDQTEQLQREQRAGHRFSSVPSWSKCRTGRAALSWKRISASSAGEWRGSSLGKWDCPWRIQIVDRVSRYPLERRSKSERPVGRGATGAGKAHQHLLATGL